MYLCLSVTIYTTQDKAENQHQITSFQLTI